MFDDLSIHPSGFSMRSFRGWGIWSIERDVYVVLVDGMEYDIICVGVMEWKRVFGDVLVIGRQALLNQ